MKANPINVELFKTLLRYDPSVGGSCLVWIVDVSNCVKAGDRAGYKCNDGYWRVRYKDMRHQAHRLVWAIATGEDAPCQIDHKDHDRENNAIENLRLAPNNDKDQQQNKKLSTRNKHGYAGVRKRKGCNRYTAVIKAYGWEYNLGSFDTPEEAHEAYLNAREKLHTFALGLGDKD